MATTKRKESAALFELLDKSTLKVPKNASSLKIPNWWSSPSNPPAAPPPPKQGAASAPLRATAAPVKPAPARPASQAFPPSADAAAAESLSEAAIGVQELPAQPRLFEPPPANVEPPSSPSIRPPTIGVNSVPIVPVKRAPAKEDGAGAPTAAPPSEALGKGLEAAVSPTVAAAAAAVPEGIEAAPPVAAAQPLALPPSQPTKARAAVPRAGETPKPWAAASGAAPAGRIFAPQTHALARKGWNSPRPGAFARLPVWAMLTAVAGLIVLIGAVVFIAQHLNRTPRTSATSVTEHGQPAGGPRVNLGDGGGNPVPASAPVAAVPQFNPDLYYVIVWSMPVPTADAARQRAWSKAGEYEAYLSRNNVDAVAEVATDPQHSMDLYVVVATQGFASASAAEDYKKKIIRIGDTLSRGVWKDANPKKGLGAIPRGN